jgi:tryptophan-specific transport protein
MITAGTAVGAGMFALPTVSAGMWFGWSLACMALSWFCMYHSSLMILEVNLHFDEGDSFDTLVRGTLGKTWNVINGILLAFLLYVLDYAYISGGGSIVNQTLMSMVGFSPPQFVSGLLFAGVLGFVVWLSTRAVDRVITILIFGMIITFALASANLTLTAEVGRLFNTGESGGYAIFALAALPFYLTSFGFHSNVPSRVKYYGKKPALIAKSMLIGSLLCFGIYLFWLISTMGNLQREEFIPIVAGGGNVGLLVEAINRVISSDRLAEMLSMFANLAIVSSFLGVSLGLFDFIADKFGFDDTPGGRFKTALIAFIPPSIGGLFFPNGFIYAIGFAGLALALSGLVIPAMMLFASRRRFPDHGFRVWGGSGLKYSLFAIGVFYATCHILGMLNVLPVYGR